MWNAPSDLDYYGQSGFSGDEPEEEQGDRTGTSGRGRTRRTTMTNGILRFNTNSPVEVALRWDDGKRVEGRYGEQVMYTLDDDRVMYVPPVVAQRIRELGIRAREAFEICKAELREDNKRWIEWRVRRIEEPRHPATVAKRSGSRGISAPSSHAQNHRNGSTHQTPGRWICRRLPTGPCFRFR